MELVVLETNFTVDAFVYDYFSGLAVGMHLNVFAIASLNELRRHSKHVQVAVLSLNVSFEFLKERGE